MQTFKVNDRVMHDGHGLGTIVEVRKAEPLEDPKYMGAYGANRYPYVVRFDNGYQDVYAPNDLEAVRS